MSLEKDNCYFQSRYYLVGTGVVRMPASWATRGDGFDRGHRLDYSGQRRGATGSRGGSSGWLVRLFGHVRKSVSSHRGGSRKR
jgi:hypothetical protein